MVGKVAARGALVALVLALGVGGTAQAERVEGVLDAVVVDAGERTRTDYWVRSGDERTRLRVDGAPGVRPGARVRVEGDVAASGVLVAGDIERTAPAPRTAAAGTTGNRQVLVILASANGPDQVTPERAAEQLGAIDDRWYEEASYGQTRFGATVTPWVEIPEVSCTSYYELGYAAEDAARLHGYEPDDYDHVMVYFPWDGRCSTWAGMGEVGGRRTWINGYMDTRVTVHELGHNLGLWHSNALSCRDAGGAAATLGDACTPTEYGDWLDAMGSSGNLGHFNAAQKSTLGWLPGSTSTVGSGETVTLSPLESRAGVRGVQVVAGSPDLWLEYRSPSGLDSFLTSYPGATDGVLVHVRAGGAAGTQLLDGRPETGSIDNAALPLGRPWTIPGGPTIRVESVSLAGARVAVYAAEPANLVLNPSFEADLANWGTWQASASRVALAGAPHGAYVARVARTSGTSYAYNDELGGPPSVRATVANATYAGSALVRAATSSAVGKPVRLILREKTSQGALVREASATVNLTNAFQRLTASARPTVAGNTIDVRVSQSNAIAGDALYLDDVRVGRGPAEPANLVRNPSFEANLANWGGWQAALSRVALTGAPNGSYVARVARSSGTAYAINDALGGPASVTATTAGARYVGSAQVRAATASSNNDAVRITLRERTPAGTVVRETSATATLSTGAFRTLTATATAVASGNTLDLRVGQTSAGAGDALYLDAVSLTRP